MSPVFAWFSAITWASIALPAGVHSEYGSQLGCGVHKVYGSHEIQGMVYGSHGGFGFQRMTGSIKLMVFTHFIFLP